MSNNSKLNNQIRIIGGKWRGRKLSFPDALSLRPSADRVRETLFNWLQFKVVSARCLDLFAGSGALSFEAVSRGAKEVVLIDSNADVIANLNKVKQVFVANNMKIAQHEAINYLKGLVEQSEQQQNSFDIIFLDPPFKQGLLDKALTLLGQSSCLADGGVIYFEHAIEDNIDISAWDILKQKQAGQVCFGLLCKR